MLSWILLLVAGALGAVLRLLLEQRFTPRSPAGQSPWRGWPVGILLANLAGTFVLGLVLGYARQHGISVQPQQWAANAQAFSAQAGLWIVATGLCAALSTVSTLFLGVSTLLAQQRSRGWCYLTATLSFGLLSAWLGYALGTVWG